MEKIDLVSDLLVPYSELSAYFLRDIDLRFIRDNELSKYTKAKVYQTEKEFDALLVKCHKRYQKTNCRQRRSDTFVERTVKRYS